METTTNLVCKDIKGNEMGKYFDRLCRIAEKENSVELIRDLNDAKLFVFSGDPCDFIPKAVARYDFKELIDGFFMPFPVIAVEDDVGVVVLVGPKLSADKMQYYLAFDFFFRPDGIASITSALVFNLEYSGKPHLPLRYSMLDDATFHVFNKDDVLIRECLFSEVNMPVEEKLKNIGAALCEVMILNTPARFVFEIAPVKTREKSKKILRTHERPTYTLLTPGEIKKRYGIDGTQRQNGARGSVSPHPRRRHRRVLRSDVYTHKQGQTIIIPACWVGPEEKQIGNKIYRVRLDV